MITGAHFLFYSQNPEADRAFFRDVLGFCSIDVGEGCPPPSPGSSWGFVTAIPLPNGVSIGLCEPKHPSPFNSQSK